MKKVSKKVSEAKEAFNDLYKIGTELILVDDSGVEHKRKLLSEAWIVGNHSIVAKFEGLSGGYDIKRVRHTMKYKESSLGFSYLVPSDANYVAV